MKKLKELWSYAVFRWCVYQAPLLVFGFLLKNGSLCNFSFDAPSKGVGGYYFGITYLGIYDLPIWVLIFAVPAVWVWRKPFWKAISFLNKKAEED